MTVSIRPATDDDLPAVAAIYNQGIAGRNATFEVQPRSAADLRPWLDGGAMPFLVATAADGRVRGWVRASSYRARDCYAGIGDFSVYVDTAAHRQGVGAALMRAFIVACEHAALWKLVSRIFPENAASRTLCARHGFREVGTYEKHAQLDGLWRDVIIVERLLAPASRDVR